MTTSSQSRCGSCSGASAPGGQPWPLVLVEVGGQSLVAVERQVRGRAGAEALVAEGVVEVGVGVHDPPQRGSQLLQVGPELGSLGR